MMTLVLTNHRLYGVPEAYRKVPGSCIKFGSYVISGDTMFVGCIRGNKSVDWSSLDNALRGFKEPMEIIRTGDWIAEFCHRYPNLIGIVVAPINNTKTRKIKRSYGSKTIEVYDSAHDASRASLGRDRVVAVQGSPGSDKPVVMVDRLLDYDGSLAKSAREIELMFSEPEIILPPHIQRYAEAGITEAVEAYKMSIRKLRGNQCEKY